MVYHSKKSSLIGSLVWGSLLWSMYVTIRSGEIFAIVIIAFTLGFFAWLWYGTNYTIKGDLLIVRCGPFKTNIDINEIKSAKKTRNPLSSAALSLDRIDIRYKRSGMILISPKDRDLFIEELMKINPSIIKLD